MAPRTGPSIARGGRALAIAIALASVALLRSAATLWGIADAFVLGALFGAALLATTFLAGYRISVPPRRAVAIGLVGGAVVVAISFVSRQLPGPPLLPAVPFVPWIAVTVLVAVAEEVAFRGALFDALFETIRAPGAVAVTSLLFALIHVPLYGWHVVLLDVGVGIWLGGLRLASGGAVAPAVAHALADLATWWL